jgi:hypothetical protein
MNRLIPSLATRLLLVVIGIASSIGATAVLATPDSIDRSGARPARREVLEQRRRIIFNDDTYEMCRQDAHTPEGFLRRRLKPLIGTHVDTISWSVLGGWGDAPVYDSQVQPIYGDAHGEPPNVWSNFTASNLKTLIKSGNDPLQLVIDFAHGNEMELFASIRMNDCHDSFLPAIVTEWKKSHPELLVDPSGVPHNPQAHPLGLYVIAQDFIHQEVRDRKFEIIEEVCRRYDIDGVDLNFMRHPVFFTSTMRGEAASQKELEIMSQFLRRIRRLVDEQGIKRGRPILLAAIVPDSIKQARHIGLDVPLWIEQDLVDIVIPGLGYSPYTLPVSEWIDVAKRHGVKVYPCINRKAPQHIPSQQVSEGFRGVASNWYRAGADGIFFWNLGTPLEKLSGDELVRTRSEYYSALPELGNPRALRGKDKLFCVDDQVLSYYQHVSSTRPLPVKLAAGHKQQVSFQVSDEQATGADSPATLELELEFQGIDNLEKLDLTLNGHTLVGGQPTSQEEGIKVEYSLESALVRMDSNVLAAALKDSTGESVADVQLSLVRLWVRYGK